MHHVRAPISSPVDLNHDDDIMEILAHTVSVDNTIQPIPKPDSQSDKGASTTDSIVTMCQTVQCNEPLRKSFRVIHPPDNLR